MSEDISRAIRAKIEKKRLEAEQVERSSTYEKRREAERALLIGRLTSRNGVAINMLEDKFANVHARRLLAGFVTSANAARIPLERVTGANAHYGFGDFIINPLLGKIHRGWDLPINTYERPRFDSTIKVHDRGIVTPNYRFHLRFVGENSHRIMANTVEEAVVSKLAEYDAEWIEPPTSTYE